MKINTDFRAVVGGCADRSDTWINDEIVRLYMDLHAKNHAHSVEVWDGRDLVGGVYGVSLGGAFFGESMFSRRTNASKIALTYLVDRLRLTGFSLFDTQFVTPHLYSLGATEISRVAYLNQLAQAIDKTANIVDLWQPQSGQDVIQRNTQTS